jgi:ketosteroid isomerase-like protein
VGTPAIPTNDPIKIAMAFIDCINAADVAGLFELMTEGHIFQDALGERFIGREKMRQGWQYYFSLVQNYKILAQDYLANESRVAIFGTASGTYAGPGADRVTHAERFWQVPAAWNAVIRGGLVAEWCVYADNQPLRKLMGERIP